MAVPHVVAGEEPEAPGRKEREGDLMHPNGRRDMIRKHAAVLMAAGLLAGAAWWARAEGPMPAIGEKAPEFALLGSDNRAHGLSGHRGRQPVVLAFFPKAFTAG
jgi:hypothetical protein